MVTNAAVSILTDAAFSITACTTGDDGNATKAASGSAVTFKADKVSYKFNRTLADHGTAQDGPEFNRITKTPETVTVETKLEKKANAALLTVLIENAVVMFAATATGGSVGTASGKGALVENVEWDYAGPSTLRFTLRQYGALFTVSAT